MENTTKQGKDDRLKETVLENQLDWVVFWIREANAEQAQELSPPAPVPLVQIVMRLTV
jgi:hypothetical protein